MNRVVVFGEMLVDRFESGPVVGGAPFNVARHLAAFGHDPLMVSAVGDDAEGRLVQAELGHFGLRDTGIQHPRGRATGVVDVTMTAEGHRFHIRDDAAWDAVDAELAQAAFDADAARSAEAPQGGPAWLYHGTLALRAPTSRAAALALIDTPGANRFVDLNWRAGHVEPQLALRVVRGARVLKINDDELALLCQWLRVAGDGLASRARIVQAALAVPLLLVTCGEHGAHAYDAEGVAIAHAPAPTASHIVDTVGAGDAFSAVVLAGLVRGWGIDTCLARATALASQVCEIRGAVPNHLATYARWMSGWD